LFQKSKSRVRDYHFQTFDRVQKAVTESVNTLREANFEFCYEALEIFWAKCVASEGCCFEGDNADLKE
jgi:hypothetical protein